MYWGFFYQVALNLLSRCSPHTPSKLIIITPLSIRHYQHHPTHHNAAWIKGNLVFVGGSFEWIIHLEELSMLYISRRQSNSLVNLSVLALSVLRSIQYVLQLCRGWQAAQITNRVNPGHPLSFSFTEHPNSSLTLTLHWETSAKFSSLFSSAQFGWKLFTYIVSKLITGQSYSPPESEVSFWVLNCPFFSCLVRLDIGLRLAQYEAEAPITKLTNSLEIFIHWVL